ncbi:hypothetical protein F66182_8590 [Fusarium sp. NRRL 66182]|nr:hypothetical protein F66182_8590 [Fusarium sp. NRRL 66182]
MCESTQRIYVCKRCKKNIFHDFDNKWCKDFQQNKPCGENRYYLYHMCEPALCTKCSSFPADSPVPFIGKPDYRGPRHPPEPRDHGRPLPRSMLPRMRLQPRGP